MASAWKKLFLIFSPTDSSAANGGEIVADRIRTDARNVESLRIVGRNPSTPLRFVRGNIQASISFSTALLIRIPASRFSSGKFSFGECARQSGKASPRRSVSTPRMLRKSDTIGMLPPSRMRTGSRSNAFLSARCAASPYFECGSVRYQGPAVASSHVEFHARRAIFLQMFLRQRDDLVAVLVRDETESELGHRLAPITVLVPCPW